MKRIFLIIALTALSTTAVYLFIKMRAVSDISLTVEESDHSGKEKRNLIVKVKGNDARLEMPWMEGLERRWKIPTDEKPKTVSTLALSDGRNITLLDSKIGPVEAQKERERAEGPNQIVKDGVRFAFSGNKQTICGLPCEEYVILDFGGDPRPSGINKIRIVAWIDRDFPDGVRIERAIEHTGLYSRILGWAGRMIELPGLAIRTVHSQNDEEVQSVQITGYKKEKLPESDFVVPTERMQNPDQPKSRPVTATDPNILNRQRALTLVQTLKMPPVSVEFSGLGAFSKNDSQEIDKFMRAAELEGLVDLWEAPHSRGLEGVSGKCGLLEAPKIGSKVIPMSNVDYYACPTQKGRQYIVSSDRRADTIRMADLSPLEIINVGAPSPFSGKTVCIVNFKYVYNPTPFGSAYDSAKGTTLYHGWARGVAKFALYDDGWQVEGWERGE